MALPRRNAADQKPVSAWQPAQRTSVNASCSGASAAVQQASRSITAVGAQVVRIPARMARHAPHEQNEDEALGLQPTPSPDWWTRRAPATRTLVVVGGLFAGAVVHLREP